MKKAFAIFFLFVFLFNTAGYFLVFHAQQYSIKQEMKANIRLGVFDDRVCAITIDNHLLSSAGSSFELQGDEFIYKGKQYDILSRKTEGNTTTFYAVNDTKEEHLLASLEDHIQNTADLTTTHKQPLHSKNLCKNVVLLYYSEISSLYMALPSNTVTYSSLECIYHSIDKKAALLPPKIA
ncbi:MAG: hypothetical protein JWO09_1351 [Bacteroidetes bacterium]|nr:hypothetical protein [Bacteroidota bacterium]